jgi:hypothetical protein
LRGVGRILRFRSFLRCGRRFYCRIHNVRGLGQRLVGRVLGIGPRTKRR